MPKYVLVDDESDYTTTIDTVRELKNEVKDFITDYGEESLGNLKIYRIGRKLRISYPQGPVKIHGLYSKAKKKKSLKVIPPHVQKLRKIDVAAKT